MAARRKRATTIGWREWLALPDLGVLAIKAKVDTGARSSSLHVVRLRRFPRDGRQMAGFIVHPVQRRARPAIETAAEVVDERVVRNPGGREELRPVIVTTVTLGDEKWDVELNLTRRDAMGFRMLLGRQAVRGRFVVDP
ncbi:MAG: ATP-dependent zinc protease family protein, partial [Acidimicrobiia bacterium]